jgi:16S rRNA (uracil1498-N3)-methyltransferase
MARRRFFVNGVNAGLAELTGDDARHLARVLRAEKGQFYEISDNRSAYLAEIRETGRDRILFRVVEPLPPKELPVEVVACVALIRFEPFEWMVQKLTELGAAMILPVAADRSEKGLWQAARKRVERWRRIAREAGEQSRRDRLPEIPDPVGFDASLAQTAVHRYFLDENPGGIPLAAAARQAEVAGEGRVAFLAGPEGGWTEAERARALAAGWTSVSLGPLILRAETAALAALSVIVSTWFAAGGPPRSQ